MTEEKIKKYFDGMIVKKSSAQEVFSSLSLPAFIRDWFLKRYADDDGEININFVMDKIKDLIPRKSDWLKILDRLMNGEKIKFLSKINVKLDIKTSCASFAIPDFGVSYNQTYIYENVWEENKKNLLSSDGDIWGIITLSYQNIIIKKQQEGKIVLESFKDFKPYTIDLDYYKECRKNFTLDEWIDILLMAIDYNPNGYESLEQKLMVLTRLLPFVEKRLNLIELAPKGTGKSYLFSQISKLGLLSSGGVMTRAKMFYDMKTRQEGLVSYYDFVALDEISTIKFPDENEMQGALKGYLESGTYTVGIKSGTADAGIILLGNIKTENMDINSNMFGMLPSVFSDSALIDRFHGFIEGWKIPRMQENLKVRGWALNTEYFAQIMHELRNDIASRAFVDKYLSYNENADTRDVTAVKRLCSAYLKILFPDWKVNSEFDVEIFKKYCLDPAINMREIINKQLCIMDVEYQKKQMPVFVINKEKN